VTINGSVGFSFETKNPFAANNVHCGGWRNQSPGTIVEEGIKLAIHCITPGRVLGRLGVTCGFDLIGGSSGKERFWKRVTNETIRQRLGLEYVVLGPSLHCTSWLRHRRCRGWGGDRNLQRVRKRTSVSKGRCVRSRRGWWVRRWSGSRHWCIAG
jgi:hypothetical protein